MTTITVDEGCLKDVDRLQSLLKLRYDTLSGETITRGATVKWAVSQQIAAMTMPVTLLDNPVNTISGYTSTNDINTFNAMNAFNTASWQNTPGQTMMVAYMTTQTSVALPSVSLTSNTPDTSHDVKKRNR